jgi:ubiquitin carboxyl-terminal hydrolase 4/11/15
MDCEKYGYSTKYDLYAVVNHYGSLNGGHYTALGKNHLNNKWYNFNDGSVSAAHGEKVQTSAAYVLFYRRRDADPEADYID